MTETRDPRVALLIDEIVALTPAPPELPPTRKDFPWGRKPLLLVFTGFAVLLFAVVTAVVVVRHGGDHASSTNVSSRVRGSSRLATYHVGTEFRTRYPASWTRRGALSS